jgi:cytochrome c oxidase subunit 3
MTAVSNVVPYRSPQAHQRTTSYIGMIMFIGAWAMMFACLFFAYGALRLGTRDWPPIGQPALPASSAAISTAIIVVSSIVFELALSALRRGKATLLAPGLALTALFGVAFLVTQYVLGAGLFNQGLTPDAGPYAAVLYGLAGIHGAHVAIGLIALAYLAVQAARGKYSTPAHLPVRLWSIYWHFVGFVWVLMFAFVFAI